MTDGDDRERALRDLLSSRRATLIVDSQILIDFANSGVDDHRGSARQAAHRLAGTLGMFGLIELGHEATRIESLLADEFSTDDFLRERTTTFASRLQEQLLSD